MFARIFLSFSENELIKFAPSLIVSDKPACGSRQNRKEGHPAVMNEVEKMHSFGAIQRRRTDSAVNEPIQKLVLRTYFRAHVCN